MFQSRTHDLCTWRLCTAAPWAGWLQEKLTFNKNNFSSSGNTKTLLNWCVFAMGSADRMSHFMLLFWYNFPPPHPSPFLSKHCGFIKPFCFHSVSSSYLVYIYICSVFTVNINMFQEGSLMNMHSHTQLSARTTKEEDINIPAHAPHSGQGWTHTPPTHTHTLHTHTHTHRRKSNNMQTWTTTNKLCNSETCTQKQVSSLYKQLKQPESRDNLGNMSYDIFF